MKPYYDEDGIQIFHGDCRQVLPDLPHFDLLCTDPPYGLGAARQRFGGNGVKRHMTGLVTGGCIPKRDYGDAQWDDRPVDPDVLQLAIAKTDWQIIWGGNYFELGKARCWLVWDKLRGDTDYADGELAWTNLDRTVRIIRWRWNGFLTEGDPRDERVHPTQKPVAVMHWAVRQIMQEFDTVLDPWMGSGTTLVASKSLNKKATGIEIEEKYCEIAAKRLAQKVLQF